MSNGHVTINTYTDEGTLRETRNFVPDFEGKIISKEYIGNTYSKRKVITANGANISYISIYNGSSHTSFENISYTYDVKNNPFRNMHSNNILSLVMQKGGASNSITYYHSNLGESESSDTQYTYNEHNFPITSTETKSNGEVITTQYFYE
jgi:hypothetical protein